MPKNRTQTNFSRALFVPSSLNEESRTVDVVFATDTPVLRYSWMREEYYEEVLDMNGADLSRAVRGLPVLNNHETWGDVGENVIGRAENIRKENDKWLATVRFSKRSNVQGMIEDVRDGIITDISFGYSVNQIERMEKQDADKYRRYMIRSWTPSEISFVTIPADPRAGVRSQNGNEYDPENLLTQKPEYIMKREQIIAVLTKRGIPVADNATDEELQALLERSLNPAPAAPAAKEEQVDETKLRADATAAERKRVTEIRAAVRAAKLDEKFADEQIDGGKSIDEVRAAIIAKWAEQDPNAGTRGSASAGQDREETMRREATIANLVMRAQPDINKDGKEFSADVVKEAHKMRGKTLLDLAKESLIRAGVDITGLDKMEVAKRAITSSTSDFPVLLEGTNRRVLLANYNAVADTWRRFCAVGSVSDFRDYKRLRMGTFSDLEAVNENGEFKNKKITDADFEKISASTKGNIINVSRQMIVNDDLSAFTRLASMLGRAAARSIENDVYALFALNSGNGPTMQDGQPLFHSTHGNIATDAGAPIVTRIDNMRVQMAQQKDKDGNDFLDIRPSLWLGPLSLGSTVRVLNGSQYDPDAANKLQRPNIVNGLFSDVIDTPRLSGTAYYVFANPSDEPVFEVAFLDGVQTPYLESQEGFRVDGLEWKIRMDYGVGAIGWRGVIKNAGA